MMTYEQVLAQISQVEDVSVFEREGEIEVTVEDFGGFDDDWSEIILDYDEEAVDALCEWLEEHALSVDGDYYQYYQFDGFVVCLGYGSFDI
jgi:hypothetical protein